MAIVTGAGRGIGAATAKALARDGAAVVLAARTPTELDAVAEEIADAGGEALALPTDISNRRQVDLLVDETLDRFSRLDFLINNAAITHPLGALWEAEPDEWCHSVQVNLFGIFLTTRAVLPHMVELRSGGIVNVTSDAAMFPIRGVSAYSVGKAGVNQLTRVVGLELRGSGVAVAAFNPGPVATSIAPRDTRLVRLRDPAQVAREIVWLCAEGLGHLAGQVVPWWDPRIRRGLALQRD